MGGLHELQHRRYYIASAQVLHETHPGAMRGQHAQVAVALLAQQTKGTRHRWNEPELAALARYTARRNGLRPRNASAKPSSRAVEGSGTARASPKISKLPSNSKDWPLGDSE